MLPVLLFTFTSISAGELQKAAHVLLDVVHDVKELWDVRGDLSDVVRAVQLQMEVGRGGKDSIVHFFHKKSACL